MTRSGSAALVIGSGGGTTARSPKRHVPVSRAHSPDHAMLGPGHGATRIEIVSLKAEGRRIDPAPDHRISIRLTWPKVGHGLRRLLAASDRSRYLKPLVVARYRISVARGDSQSGRPVGAKKRPEPACRDRA